METCHGGGERQSEEEGWFTGRWDTADANNKKEARRSCREHLPEHQLGVLSVASRIRCEWESLFVPAFPRRHLLKTVHQHTSRRAFLAPIKKKKDKKMAVEFKNIGTMFYSCS